jgi:hypothetical protein
MFPRRLKQLKPLAQRLVEESQRLREEASSTPPGIERQQLIRRARQADTAYQINAWITSPGLRAPV